jgi:hypothetical protein
MCAMYVVLENEQLEVGHLGMYNKFIYLNKMEGSIVVDSLVF